MLHVKVKESKIAFMTFKFYRSTIICDFVELLFSVENMGRKFFNSERLHCVIMVKNLDLQGVSEIDDKYDNVKASFSGRKLDGLTLTDSLLTPNLFYNKLLISKESKLMGVTQRPSSYPCS